MRCSSSSAPAPGFTHAAPFSSKRVHPKGTNRGLGKRITADHSTSVGKRPTEKFTQAVQALLSPAKTPFCRRAVVCADISQPCQPSRSARCLSWLTSAAPILSAARVAIREVEVAEVGILSRLLCIIVALSVQPTSADHTNCHSVWLTVPAEPSSRMLEDLGPFAPRRARLSLLTLFRSSARVALMPTVSMLVLVVRLSWLVGRSVAQCPSACVLSRSP